MWPVRSFETSLLLRDVYSCGQQRSEASGVSHAPRQTLAQTQFLTAGCARVSRERSLCLLCCVGRWLVVLMVLGRDSSVESRPATQREAMQTPLSIDSHREVSSSEDFRLVMDDRRRGTGRSASWDAREVRFLQTFAMFDVERRPGFCGRRLLQIVTEPRSYMTCCSPLIGQQLGSLAASKVFPGPRPAPACQSTVIRHSTRIRSGSQAIRLSRLP